MKKTIVSVITITSVAASLASCGGRTPNPVNARQADDVYKSCESIQYEMLRIENKMDILLPKKSKLGKNVALGAAGCLFAPAWLFMDFRNADKKEYEAYKERYDRLSDLAIAKKCGTHAKDYPSVEELRKLVKAAKK